jgi:hypothetical protein
MLNPEASVAAIPWGTDTALDSNLVSMLGVAVGTSVFTIGFLSHRIHASLIALRQTPDKRDASDMLDDARSP